MEVHPMHVSSHPRPARPAHEGAPSFDVVVVGAGVAGLSAALTAASGGAGVLVLDGHPAGGRARTTEVDGVLHNVGPHALYRAGAFAGLLARHGVIVTGGGPPEIPAHLVRGEVAHRLALTPVAITRTKLLRPTERAKLLAMFSKVQLARPRRLAGSTVEAWLGDAPQHVRQFLEMLIRLSTYTNAPDVLDAGAAVGQLKLAIGSGVQYVDGGWGSLIEAMVAALERLGGEVRTAAEVQRVRSIGDAVEIATADGEIRADAVVIASGGPEMAARLTGVSIDVTGRLTAPVSASVLDLVLRSGRPVLAFGLDRPDYLSAHAPAARLATDGRGLVSVLRYHRPGSPTPNATEMRHELRAFAGLAGIDPGEVERERFLHRLVVSHGAPTASAGGLAGRPGVDALGLPGVYLAGDWVGPTGLLADAAAASGRLAAAAALGRRASIAA
jgi:phytoene dehydrogenase-like protein